MNNTTSPPLPPGYKERAEPLIIGIRDFARPLWDIVTELESSQIIMEGYGFEVEIRRAPKKDVT